MKSGLSTLLLMAMAAMENGHEKSIVKPVKQRQTVPYITEPPKDKEVQLKQRRAKRARKAKRGY